MTSTELTIIGLLVAIAGQTTYTTYRTWKGGAQQRSQAIFVDTSVLMDGRIVAIAQAGFIPGKLVIPRSVIGELQFLADNADSDKRSRARQGLDVVSVLQAMENVTVELLQDGSKAEEGVDERLLSLAKKHGGQVCTIDFNLNKVAQVENIPVLNVNELAKNLRMAYLPGDVVSLGLTTAGSDSHQAVGHLDDGTMVVVEQARQQIGQTIEVEIIRSLQTDAGRMMFAKPVNSKNASKQSAGAPSKKKPPLGGTGVQARKNTTIAKTGMGAKPRSSKQSPTPTPAKVNDNTDRVANKKTSPKRPAKHRTSRNNEDRLMALLDSQDEA